MLTAKWPVLAAWTGTVLLGLCLCLAPMGVHAEIFTGSVGGDYNFITRFSFNQHMLKTTGAVSFDVHFDTEINMVLKLYEFHDGPQSWGLARQLSSCSEVAKHVTPHQAYTLKRLSYTHYSLSKTSVIGSNRDRFYYYVLASEHPTCSPLPSGTFTIHTTRATDDWGTELGVNVAGLNTLYVVFFVFYVILLSAHFYSVRKLSTTLTFVHPVIQVLSAILFTEFLSVLIHMIHYANLTKAGRGLYSADCAAAVFGAIARVMLIVLLMLLAKSWTISTTEVHDRSVIIGLAIMFGVLYTGSLIFQFVAFDREQIDTPSAVQAWSIVVIVIGLLYALWFAYAGAQSTRSENNPVKRGFLVKLTAFYTVYLLSIPGVAILSYTLDPWVREKVTEGFAVCATFVGLLVLVILFWHSNADKYFTFDKTVEITSDADFQTL